jgi:hypothetical protein
MIKTGMYFHQEIGFSRDQYQEISVPEKGHYCLRAEAHDRRPDGAVDVNLDNLRV